MLFNPKKTLKWISISLCAAYIGACGGGSSNSGGGSVPTPSTSPTPTTSPSPTPSPTANAKIRLNQVGFHSSAPKIAIVPNVTATEFAVVSNSDDATIFTGQLSTAALWAPSNEQLKLADFSSVTQEGEFHIEVQGVDNSHTFSIGNSALYDDLLDASLKAYYYNRASLALTEEFAGVFARPLGHPDDNVLVHASAAGPVRTTGQSISAAKGWYDAGDYNKYVVNSGISTYTLLAAFEHYPSVFNRDITIPESANGVPDILDEIRWNLEWMLAMQDPDDGGVYHKLTTLNFSGTQMPHLSTAQRYVVKKGTAATLNFAAVMAAASRVFESYDASFAQQMQNAAVNAWAWAQLNPSIVYSQGSADLSDVNTGEYGDSNFNDEFAWAAAELFILTEEQTYFDAFLAQNAGASVPYWGNVEALAFISLQEHAQSLISADAYNSITLSLSNLANTIVSTYQNSEIRVPVTSNDFVWGSNSGILNKALILLQAYRKDPQASYLAAAYSSLDYILGRNATEYSMVTGFGDVSPMDIHHRASFADGIAAPIPGFVVGGPQPGQQDACNYPATEPATTYLDDWCSYSTNEVTINWNAPLVYVVGALRGISSEAN